MALLFSYSPLLGFNYLRSIAAPKRKILFAIKTDITVTQGTISRKKESSIQSDISSIQSDESSIQSDEPIIQCDDLAIV